MARSALTETRRLTGWFRKATIVILPIAFVALLLGLWQYRAIAGVTPFIPPLEIIAENFARNWLRDRLGTDLIPSLTRLAQGYTISVILGVVGGMLMGFIATIGRSMMPMVNFLRSIPSSALVPLAIVLFGIGDVGKVFLIVSSATWPVLLNTVSGASSFNPVAIEAMRVYRLPLVLRIRKVLLPALLPDILAGARTGLGIALILVVVSEMFASINGIGHFVVAASRTFRIADMWSGVVLIGIIGFLLNAVFLRTERWLLRHHGIPQRGSVT